MPPVIATTKFVLPPSHIVAVPESTAAVGVGFTTPLKATFRSESTVKPPPVIVILPVGEPAAVEAFIRT